jgi:diguanylate cyclase (GGDEF)-like protein
VSETRRKGLPPTREVPEIPEHDEIVWPEEGGFVEEPSTAERAATPIPQLLHSGQHTPHLVLVFGRNIGQVFRLDRDTMRIGRDRSCEIQFSDNGISRQHLAITRDPAGFTLRDLGSRNGTYLNEQPIHGPQPLRNNDLIHIGSNTVLKFIDSDNPEVDYALSMYEAAMNDVLTGVHNRRYLEQQLAKELAFARRHDMPLALLLMDLDHFKQVNDSHGHPVGDQVLREFAQLVSGSVRTEDTVGRYGGEEFVALCRKTGGTGATAKARRIRELTARHVFCAETLRLRLTVSIGIVVSDRLEQPTVEAVLAYADHALYQAKQGGRDRVVLYGE